MEKMRNITKTEEAKTFTKETGDEVRRTHSPASTGEQEPMYPAKDSGLVKGEPLDREEYLTKNK